MGGPIRHDRTGRRAEVGLGLGDGSGESQEVCPYDSGCLEAIDWCANRR